MKVGTNGKKNLQLRGLDQVRILDARYDELTAELKPGKVYKRSRK